MLSVVPSYFKKRSSAPTVSLDDDDFDTSSVSYPDDPIEILPSSKQERAEKSLAKNGESDEHSCRTKKNQSITNDTISSSNVNDRRRNCTAGDTTDALRLRASVSQGRPDYRDSDGRNGRESLGRSSHSRRTRTFQRSPSRRHSLQARSNGLITLSDDENDYRRQTEEGHCHGSLLRIGVKLNDSSSVSKRKERAPRRNSTHGRHCGHPILSDNNGDDTKNQRGLDIRKGKKARETRRYSLSSIAVGSELSGGDSKETRTTTSSSTGRRRQKASGARDKKRGRSNSLPPHGFNLLDNSVSCNEDMGIETKCKEKTKSKRIEGRRSRSKQVMDSGESRGRSTSVPPHGSNLLDEEDTSSIKEGNTVKRRHRSNSLHGHARKSKTSLSTPTGNASSRSPRKSDSSTRETRTTKSLAEQPNASESPRPSKNTESSLCQSYRSPVKSRLTGQKTLSSPLSPDTPATRSHRTERTERSFAPGEDAVGLTAEDCESPASIWRSFDEQNLFESPNVSQYFNESSNLDSNASFLPEAYNEITEDIPIPSCLPSLLEHKSFHSAWPRSRPVELEESDKRLSQSDLQGIAGVIRSANFPVYLRSECAYPKRLTGLNLSSVSLLSHRLGEDMTPRSACLASSSSKMPKELATKLNLALGASQVAEPVHRRTPGRFASTDWSKSLTHGSVDSQAGTLSSLSKHTEATSEESVMTLSPKCQRPIRKNFQCSSPSTLTTSSGSCTSPRPVLALPGPELRSHFLKQSSSNSKFVMTPQMKKPPIKAPKNFEGKA